MIRLNLILSFFLLYPSPGFSTQDPAKLCDQSFGLAPTKKKGDKFYALVQSSLKSFPYKTFKLVSSPPIPIEEVTPEIIH